MTDRRVFGVSASLDRAHHDFARVNANAHFHGRLALAFQSFGVLAKLLLHRERGIQCPLCVVLVGERRAEQCKNTVTGRLGDVAIVPMHRRHHQLQHRVDERASIFGIKIALQLSGTLDVSEQRRNGLALPFRLPYWRRCE